MKNLSVYALNNLLFVGIAHLFGPFHTDVNEARDLTFPETLLHVYDPSWNMSLVCSGQLIGFDP
jgi:hypothetical protein